MKRFFCLLTLVSLLMGCFTAIAEEGARKAIPYDTVPVELREAFEAEKADAPAKAKKSGPLSATQRGYEGYVGSKSNGPLTVKYTISDSMVSVGETVYIEVEISCSSYPVLYMYSGTIMSEAGLPIGDIPTHSYRKNAANFKEKWSYTPTTTGRFNFVLAVEDWPGNRVILTTNSVQVKAVSAPEQNFDNVAVDESLVARITLDKNKLKVGETITATCVLKSDIAPFAYAAGWTLMDAKMNTLDEETWDDMVYTSGTNTLTFSYTPQQTGDVLFVLSAIDADKNAIAINSPTVAVSKATSSSGTTSPGGSTGPVVPDWDEMWATVPGTKCSMKVPVDADLSSDRIWFLRLPGESGVSSLILNISNYCYSESFLRDKGHTVSRKTVDGVDVLIDTRENALGTQFGVQFKYGGKEYRLYTPNIKGTRLKVFQRMLETMTFKTVSNPKPRLPGDADDNGSVSISDAALILQYAAGETSSINTSNAEVTGDGAVNAQDALLILQYVAGWDVTLE